MAGSQSTKYHDLSDNESTTPLAPPPYDGLDLEAAPFPLEPLSIDEPGRQHGWHQSLAFRSWQAANLTAPIPPVLTAEEEAKMRRWQNIIAIAVLTFIAIGFIAVPTLAISTFGSAKNEERRFNECLKKWHSVLSCMES